jgi:hypothetical protein
MKLLGMYFIKGATAYEFQAARSGFRYTYLKGSYWRGRIWRRISFQWWPKT